MLLKFAVAARWVIRVTGPAQVGLGLLFWAHRALNLLPLHMLIGSIFVLALLTLAGLGAWAGAGRGLSLLGLATGAVIPLFGMLQVRLFPGTGHWIVQVVHLLLGVAGMTLAARLDRGLKNRTAKAADPALPQTLRAA